MAVQSVLQIGQKGPLPRSHYQWIGIEGGKNKKKKKYDISFAVKKSVI